jgi:hypothetical protein
MEGGREGGANDVGTGGVRSAVVVGVVGGRNGKRRARRRAGSRRGGGGVGRGLARECSMRMRACACLRYVFEIEKSGFVDEL